MDSRTARTQALALRIGELLDLGMSADAIRAQLIMKGMPSASAAELVLRVMGAKARARSVAARAKASPVRVSAYAVPAARSMGGAIAAPRRAAAPAVMGMAVLTFFAGFQLLRGGDSADSEVVARLETDIASTQALIYGLEAELVARTQQAQEIEVMRARIAGGPVRFADREAYRTAVDRYKRRLSAWNSSLARYQQIAEEYTTLVAVHNAKVDSLSTQTRGTSTQTRYTAGKLTAAGAPGVRMSALRAPN